MEKPPALSAAKKPRGLVGYLKELRDIKGFIEGRKARKREEREHWEMAVTQECNYIRSLERLEDNRRANLGNYVRSMFKAKQDISIEEFNDMDDLQFKLFITKVFQRLGFSIELTSGSGDEGIDIIITKGDRKYCAKCKRHQKPIGQPVIRDFYGAMMNIGARKGFVVTSGIFSLAAESFAEGKPIELIDGEGLLKLIRDIEG